MDLYETIQTHAASIRMPLYAVTLSAAAKADTPVILILHWHGFQRDAVPHLPSSRWPLRPVAGSALQLGDSWRYVEDLDEAMLDAAWKLGAWQLERTTCRPWWRLNAPAGETLACHRAFGQYPGPDETHLFVNAPDQEALMELAASRGYIRWLFHPRRLGVWSELEGDDVSLKDGTEREGACPVAPLPHDRHQAGTVRYRLGQGNGLLL